MVDNEKNKKVKGTSIYQAALNNLIKQICLNKVSCKECNFEKVCNSKIKCCADILQELVDKATSKKTIHVSSNFFCKGYIVDYEEFECPNCGQIYRIPDDDILYCWKYGQRLELECKNKRNIKELLDL